MSEVEAKIDVNARMLSAVNKDGVEPFHTPYQYKSIFFNRVFPDPENRRFFPCKILSDVDAQKVINRSYSKAEIIEKYDADEYVLIGKGCIVNCVSKDDPRSGTLKKNIESIIELSKNIAVSEVIQAPTMYPIEYGNFRLLTGHRRFLAMLYALGQNAAGHFKVYDSRPALTKVRQFQENASREELPQFGKINAFLAAQVEIDALSKARKQKGLSDISVRKRAEIMGISLGAYDNYSVLSRYPVVVSKYETGLIMPLLSAKKLILDTEKQYRDKNNKENLSNFDKLEINKELKKLLENKKRKNKKNNSYTLRNISSGEVIKRLCDVRITELPLNIEWENIDWNNKKHIESIFDKAISFLQENTSNAI